MRLKTPCRVYHSNVRLGKCADRSGHSHCPANDHAPNPNRYTVRLMAPAWNIKHNLAPALCTGDTRF